MKIEREADGRRLAEVPDLPGAMAYGPTRPAAIASVKALALRALADRIEPGEEIPAFRKCSPRPHEWLTFHQGQSSPGCVAPHRGGHQAAVGSIASDPWPVRLARIARHSGLTIEDL